MNLMGITMKLICLFKINSLYIQNKLDFYQISIYKKEIVKLSTDKIFKDFKIIFYIYLFYQ